MRRLILAGTVAVALSVPATVATVVVSGPAWAVGVSCKNLTGYAVGAHKFKIQKCTPANAEKTLSGRGTNLTTVGGPTTDSWKWNGGKTTVVSLSVALTAGVCGAGYTGYTDTGTVTGGTSTYTTLGDPVSLVVCAKSANPYKGNLHLAAGTMATL
jgi:hypothetical protein